MPSRSQIGAAAHSTSAGTRLATKNGTAGTSRIRKQHRPLVLVDPVLDLAHETLRGIHVCGEPLSEPHAGGQKDRRRPGRRGQRYCKAFRGMSRRGNPPVSVAMAAPGQREGHDHDIDSDKGQHRQRRSWASRNVSSASRFCASVSKLSQSRRKIAPSSATVAMGDHRQGVCAGEAGAPYPVGGSWSGSYRVMSSCSRFSKCRSLLPFFRAVSG